MDLEHDDDDPERVEEQERNYYPVMAYDYDIRYIYRRLYVIV